MEQHVAVGLAQRMSHHAITHQAAVDVEILPIGLRPRGRRQTHPAVQLQIGAGMLHLQALRSELIAQQRGHARQLRLRIRSGAQAAQLAPIVTQHESHLRIRQRQRTQQFVHVTELGTLGTQEAPPRRQRMEQLAHLDRAALRMLRRLRRTDLPAIGLHARRMRGALRARSQLQARNRRDRGQCLAAESHAAHMQQIVERGDLAGRMLRQRQQQFIGGDAAAVVTHANQPCAAAFELDFDALRAGIETVLDQFLDHRSRPLDHLAGCDLVDEHGRQTANRHGGFRKNASIAGGNPVAAGWSHAEIGSPLQVVKPASGG